jgi:hypothetical protein
MAERRRLFAMNQNALSAPLSQRAHPSDALYVTADALLFTNRDRINTLATGARLPTMHGVPEFVAAGGLIAYAT